MSKIRQHWTEEQDKTLKKLVKKYGKRNKWGQISEQFCLIYGESYRNDRQCKERYIKYLSPKLDKAQWTHQQIREIFRMHQSFGNKWKKIAKNLKKGHSIKVFRIDNDVKNQFLNCIRRGIRRICKQVQIQNSSSKLRKIKPKALANTIYKFDGFGQRAGGIGINIYELLLEFSQKELGSQMQEKIKQKDFKEKLRQLINSIFFKCHQADSQNINSELIMSSIDDKQGKKIKRKKIQDKRQQNSEILLLQNQQIELMEQNHPFRDTFEDAPIFLRLASLNKQRRAEQKDIFDPFYNLERFPSRGYQDQQQYIDDSYKQNF